MKFCPKCGKKGIKGVLCSKCTAEKSVIEFKDIKLKYCINCKAYLFRNKWIKTNTLESGVRKAVKKSLKKKTTAEINPILPKIEPKPGLTHNFEVEIKMSPKEKYYIPAKIELTTCPKCSKEGTQYFEGILQLRNPNPEVVEFIRKEAKDQKSRGIYITDEKDVAYGKGIDFYFTSQKYIQNLGLKLQKTFGGILKINPKLFSKSRQTSKDLYRVNVLFELLDFKIGDVILVDNKILKVTDLGKKGSGVDLKTGKKTNFDYKKQPA
ncbi:NMD3-related protein [candidate division KSB1 bacterium]